MSRPAIDPEPDIIRDCPLTQKRRQSRSDSVVTIHHDSRSAAAAAGVLPAPNSLRRKPTRSQQQLNRRLSVLPPARRVQLMCDVVTALAEELAAFCGRITVAGISHRTLLSHAMSVLVVASGVTTQSWWQVLLRPEPLAESQPRSSNTETIGERTTHRGCKMTHTDASQEGVSTQGSTVSVDALASTDSRTPNSNTSRTGKKE